MTLAELEHIKQTYRTAQHLQLGHVYRDLMKLVLEVERLRSLLQGAVPTREEDLRLIREDVVPQDHVPKQ